MASVAVHRASPPPTPPLEEINRDTPPPDEDRRPPRPSSPDTCPICLDTFDDKKDKAYSDNCYHIFCFECLLEWSNNKRECPLCKRPFKEINHKIKSHTEYEVHRLPPQQPDLDLGRHVPWTNVTWEWMRQMRQQFIHNRQQQLERIRNGTNRHTALRPRNVLRPATTDRRRFIYRYGLYCEGARAPGSGPLRHRRTTPDFYRRNPAQIHRLVPWLNRELVAILSHRDNVQFVLDHILAEIRRVDMRSQQFMESIRPFTLAHTDHFMHEFYQFAMSPMDMASWDTYAQYPPTPRGTLPIPVGEERVTSVTRSNPVPRANPVARANPVSRSNITDPPGDSSSSDSDDEAPRLLLRGTQRPDRPGGLQTLQSNATYHNVAPPTSMLGGRRRMSWHRQRLIAEELGTIDIQPTTSTLFNGRRRSRWESDAANSSSSGAASSPHSSRNTRNTRNTRWDDNSNYQSPADTGSGGASRSAQEEPYLTASQRSAQRRLRRSLNRINNSSLLGRYSSSDLDPDHITTIDLESEPTTSAENSGEPRAAAGYESLVNRVRSFLNTIDDELSNDGVGVTRQSNLSMPTLGELTGEINSDIDVTDMPVPPLPGNSLASTSSGSRMSDNRPFLFDHGMEDSQSLPSLPSLTPARADRPASPSSSHSSDCILVQEEKPYRARTPIMLSDESQDDEEGPIDVLTDIGRKISSADRRLSESSVDYETAGPSSGRKLSPKRRKHKRFASPDLTSSSDNERDARPSHTHSQSSSAPNNPSTSFSASVPTLPRNESSDSDCMVTFQATKPKLLSNLLKHVQREKSERERETKKSKHKKEKRKSKKDKSSDRDMKKRKRKHRSPSDQRHHNEKISRKSPDIDVEGLDDENKHTSPQINIRKKHKKSKRHHQSDSDKDANSHRPRRLQSDASIIGNIGQRIMNEPLSESRTSLQSSTGEISPSKPSASVVPNVRSTSSPDNECSSSSGMTYVQTGASSSQPPVSEGDNPQSSRSPNIDIPTRTHNDQQEQQQLTQPNQDAQDAAQIDVRQQIRKFAKEKIASKYHGTNCKKHNRGHKKSSKQALLN